MPTGDSRGVETFFDGKTFDPADPAGLSGDSLDQGAWSEGVVMSVVAI
jgi:hypothetical protein